MVSELVAKLRAKRMRVHDLSGVGWEDDPDCIEAADRIESLSRQLEEAREALKAENEACAAVCQVWLDQFAARGRHLQHTSPEKWANDAIEDIMDAIRARAKETVSHG